jgi:hypothetical protein
VEEEDLPVVEVGVAEVDVVVGEDDDDHHLAGEGVVGAQEVGGKTVERLSGESELEERGSPAHELERVPTRVSTRSTRGQGQGGAPGLPSLPLTMPLSIPLEMSAVTVASL